jgi:hypothetical protein
MEKMNTIRNAIRMFFEPLWAVIWCWLSLFLAAVVGAETVAICEIHKVHHPWIIATSVAVDAAFPSLVEIAKTFWRNFSVAKYGKVR